MDHAGEARRVAELLAAGEIQTVRSMFNESMAESPQVSPEAMAAVWKSVIDNAGDYASSGDPVVHTTVDVPLIFTGGKGKLTVSYDREGKIGGMLIQPGW